MILNLKSWTKKGISYGKAYSDSKG
jgi:hypothetical protein